MGRPAMNRDDQVALVAAVDHQLQTPAIQQAIEGQLGSLMDSDAFKAAAISFLTEAARKPEWVGVHPASVVDVIVQCAQMALPLGDSLGYVYAIPYSINRQGGTVRELKAMVSAKGFKALMERAPNVIMVRAELVHVRDEFSYHNGVVNHQFDPFDDDRVFLNPESTLEGEPNAGMDHGLRGGYLEIHYLGGKVGYHVVSFRKIDKNRLVSENPYKRQGSRGFWMGPWGKWYREMALKTIYRDAWNRRAITYDPAHFLGVRALDLAEKFEREALREDPDRATAAALPAPSKELKMADLVPAWGEKVPLEPEQVEGEDGVPVDWDEAPPPEEGPDGEVPGA